MKRLLRPALSGSARRTYSGAKPPPMLPAAVNVLPNAPQQAAGVLTLKLLAGDVTAIPVGSVLRAAVLSVADGKAELQVNGQPLTVRAPPTLTPGTELAVRISPAGIEAVVIPPTANPNPTGPTPNAPPAPAVVVVAHVAAPPQAAQASVAVQATTFAPAPLTPVVPGPTPTVPATDGTVSPTSAFVAAPTRPGTAIAPAPPPAAQPTTVAPNVPTRTATPAAQQQVAQLVGRPLVPLPPNARSVSQSAPNARAAAPRSAKLPSPAAPQLSLVEVLPGMRDGKPQVRIDGRPQLVADSAEPLTPGTQFVARVERTSGGVRLLPVPVSDSPQLTTAVAAAILKQDRAPPVAQVLPLLLKELATVPLPTGKPAIAEAVHEVRAAATAILPDTPRPPTAPKLESLVEDGGQKYEGKLARQADGGDGPSPHDLKGALLKLFEVVPAIAHAQYSAAKATLDGIEQQQAANVLSQQAGGPTVFQVPFPDGPQWRTLHLAVEREAGRSARGERSRPFRLLMHVPLSGLGDTWIDAGLNGEQFRAAVYLEHAAARDRVREDLPALRDELRGVGFAEVLLDVRPTADLTDKQRQRGAAMTAGVPVSATVIDARA